MKWEYKTLKVRRTLLASYKKVEEELNGLGLEGWELVSFNHHTINGTTADELAVLKRKLK